MTAVSHRPATDTTRRGPSRSLHPFFLIAVYIGLALAPLVIAYAQGFPPRDWRDEFSSALALTGFAGLLIEFLLSGRFRFVSTHLGIDTTMRFHQLMARSLTVFILVHPFLYVTPILNDPFPWDTTGVHTLGLTGVSLITGLIAWLALMAMVILAVCREQTSGSYEAWRLSHGIAALLVAVFGLHHTLAAGRYSGHDFLTYYWFALVGIAVFTLLWVYALKPASQLKHPYVVRSVRSIAARTWELVVEPRAGDTVGFRAGQFVWLNVGNSPFSLCENPFSIASVPAEKGRLAFVIKETGDFTRSIRQIAPGTTAYVDGPHGNLTIEGREAAGIALIAGGVGIAPLLAILRQLRHDRDKRPCVLLYGNRVPAQIVYADELHEMQNELDLRIEYVVREPTAAWRGHRGIIDADCVNAMLERPDAAAWLYFVCGPLPMIESTEQALLAMGVARNQIVSERFHYD